MTERAAPAAEEFVDFLYRAHAVSLVRVALLLVGDQPSAEDVVQDAFLQLYRGLPRLRDRDKALPYLRTSVVNGSRSVLAQHIVTGPAATGGPGRARLTVGATPGAQPFSRWPEGR